MKDKISNFTLLNKNPMKDKISNKDKKLTAEEKY
jgi:hypothetical protein